MKKITYICTVSNLSYIIRCEVPKPTRENKGYLKQGRGNWGFEIREIEKYNNNRLHKLLYSTRIQGSLVHFKNGIEVDRSLYIIKEFKLI